MRLNWKIGETYWARRTDSGVGSWGHFRVIEETKISFVCVPIHTPEWAEKFPDSQTKIPKTGNGWLVGTQEDAEGAQWLLKNRHRISRDVEGMTDYILLRNIAILIGFKEGE